MPGMPHAQVHAKSDVTTLTKKGKMTFAVDAPEHSNMLLLFFMLTTETNVISDLNVKADH